MGLILVTQVGTDMWIWSAWMTYPSPPSSQGGMVELELWSLDAYFCLLSTMPGGCQFIPGQAFGTSELCGL